MAYESLGARTCSFGVLEVSAWMNVNFVVGVSLHESAAAAGPSEPEGLQGGRSLDPPKCAALFLEVVDELGVGVGLKSVGGSGWLFNRC